jgi:hypothetical protein
MKIDDLVFVGLNGRVAALERATGEIIWEWKRGGTYVSLLVEGERLFVSVDGYTYCLDGRTGEELWFNPLKGYGTGPAALATAGKRTPDSFLGSAAAKRASESD